MSSKTPDQIVCSTDDVTLRESDLRSLGACQFVSDAIVSFASTELERSMAPAVRTRVALLQATTAFLGAMMDVEPALVANLNLTDKELVALPVNNNDDAGVAFGGTHWSLLVYVRALDQFWYYDSMRDYNLSAARVVARNFARALGATKATKFVCKDAPQQTNGYDCGVFLIEFMDQLVRKLVDDEATDVARNVLRDETVLTGDAIDADARRNSLRVAIEQLRAARASK